MNQDTKDKTVEWLFNQGFSAVLLTAILGFLGYGTMFLVPAHLEQIQEGYKENAEYFNRGMESFSDSHQKGMERIAESHDRDRDLFIQLLEIQRNEAIRQGKVNTNHTQGG